MAEMNNNKKSPNVPPLRFPEFKGEWENCSLGASCTGFDYGLNSPAIDFDGIHKYIRITDINDETGKLDSDTIVSPRDLNSDSLVKENDILFARTGASVGKTYLQEETEPNVYFAGFLIRANVKPEFNPYFVYSETKTQRYLSWIKLMSMRSGQPGINSKEYMSFKFKIPPIEEQKKIGRLLRLIDARIEVQRKTIEDSSVLKKDVETSFFESLSPTDIAKVGDVVDYERPDQYIVKSDRYKNAGIPVLTANKGFILGYTDEMDGIYAKGAAVIFDDFTEASQYVDFPFKVKSSAIKILTPKTNQINSLYIQAYLEYLKLESSEHKRHYLSDIVGYDFLIPSQGDFSSFIGTLATVIQWIEVLKKEQIVLQRLRQALLASLFA